MSDTKFSFTLTGTGWQTNPSDQGQQKNKRLTVKVMLLLIFLTEEEGWNAFECVIVCSMHDARIGMYDSTALERYPEVAD